MGFVNKVMLMGNTTRDPELRTLPSGTTVCDFAMATNRVYKTTAGEEKQETVFIDCTAFGRTGEVIAEYCPKGRALFVEGRLHYETWEDKNGNRRSKLSVIVENFQFVGARDGDSNGSAPVRQRVLPLADETRRDDDRPQKAPAVGSPAARRAANGGDRFQSGQRPADTAAARTPRKPAGKPARAAAGPNGHGHGESTGTATAEAKVVDQMADEAEQLEDADLPF
jgi:single-strand DNA-binding protein